MEFKLLLFLLFFTHTAPASPKKKNQKTRNSEPGCAVVINEFSHRSRVGAFVEIAKVCEPGKKIKHKRLGGYYLLILKSETRELVLFSNLNRKELKEVEPMDEEKLPAEKIRHSKHSIPKGARQKKQKKGKGSNGGGVTEIPSAGVSSDTTVDPCHLVFDCVANSDRKKRSVSTSDTFNITTTNMRRIRRDVSTLQRNVRGLYVQEIKFDTSQSVSYTVLLMKVPDTQGRVVEGRSNFVLGQPLSQAAVEEIKERLKDYIIVNPVKNAVDHTLIAELLPQGIEIRFLDFWEKKDDFSLSKCDTYVVAQQHDGFIVSTPTPNSRNECKKYRPHPFTLTGSGLRKQSKQLVANVVVGLREKKNDPTWAALNEVQAASAILNLHENTVYKVMKEYDSDADFSDPQRRVSKCPTTDLNEQQKKTLYSVISSFFKQNKVAYFDEIHEEFIKQVNAEDLAEGRPLPYKCSRWSFAKILRKNNYRYGRINERDAVLFRKANVEWRKRYLDAIARYDADPDWDVLYQDETWIDPYSRCNKGWRKNPRLCDFQERVDFTFANAKVSRGPRLIVLGIGGKTGFVPGTTLVWTISKSKVQSDYHGNINSLKFYEWMEDVLSKLTKPTAIVIDNSPVHTVSTAPKINDNKPEILAWLEEKVEAKTEGHTEIPPNYRELTLDKLREILKRIKLLWPQYRVDELIKSKGHVAIRLPPYQADLNPIELIWSDLKRRCREENREQNTKKTLETARTVLNSFTSEQWTRHINHVKRLEAEYREGDKAFLTLVSSRPSLEENFVERHEDELEDGEEDDGEDL